MGGNHNIMDSILPLLQHLGDHRPNFVYSIQKERFDGKCSDSTTNLVFEEIIHLMYCTFVTTCVRGW